MTDAREGLRGARGLAMRARNAAAIVWGFLRNGWAKDRHRLSLWAPVLLGFGAALYFALDVEPPIWLAGPALIWIALAVWAQIEGWDIAVIFLWGAACVHLGFAAAVLRTAAIDTSSLRKTFGPADIEGRVSEIIPLAPSGFRMVLSNVRLGAPRASDPPLPKRARLAVRGAVEAPAPGDWISVRATMLPLPGPVIPGGFDYGRSLWFQGIGATGYALGPPKVKTGGAQSDWSQWMGAQVASLRRLMSARIMAAMAPAEGAVATALLTGERSAIPQETLQDFRDSSLAHLLSISGLHMMLVGFGVFSGVRLFLAALPAWTERIAHRKFAALAAFAASAFYLVLSGASTPTIRSFLMIGLVFAAIMLDRPALTMRLVAVAAAVLLLLFPESIMDASFQMSFAAVVALIAYAEWQSARQKSSPSQEYWGAQFWRYFFGLIVTSLLAGLATAPFAAYHFHRVAEYGVLANLLAIPLVGFVVMPAGVLALILMPLGLEAPALAVMQWGLGVVLQIADWVAALPGATHLTGQVPLSSLLFFAGGGLWLCLWMAPWRWLGVLAIAAGALPLTQVQTFDVLIASGARQVALRTQDGAWALLDARKGRFEVEQWFLALGESEGEIQAAIARGRALFLCDELGCAARLQGGGRILIAHEVQALREDCAHALIVVDLTVAAAAPCIGPAKIIRADEISASGAIGIRVDGPSITTLSSRAASGDRPWTRTRDAVTP